MVKFLLLVLSRFFLQQNPDSVIVQVHGVPLEKIWNCKFFVQIFMS